MMRTLVAMLVVAGFALSIPLSGLAKDKDKGEKAAGGSAAEHRSPQAEENSNAQWSEGADKGQERAEERRGEKTRDAESAKVKSKDVAAPPPAAPKAKAKGKGKRKD